MYIYMLCLLILYICIYLLVYFALEKQEKRSGCNGIIQAAPLLCVCANFLLGASIEYEELHDPCLILTGWPF